MTKTTWKTKAITAKTIEEFKTGLERALNDLEEDEFRIVKIEDMRVSDKWDYHYQTVVIACKNPIYVLGPAGTTIALP